MTTKDKTQPTHAPSFLVHPLSVDIPRVTMKYFRFRNNTLATNILIILFLLLCYVLFVSLSILVVMYVPFCVIVLFFVLFVCECVLDNCRRHIGVFFVYPNWRFSVIFPQLYGKFQGITRKDETRPALPNFFLVIVIFLLVIFMCIPSSVFCVLVCKCILLPPGVNSIAI
jgi:hypothetical protein